MAKTGGQHTALYTEPKKLPPHAMVTIAAKVVFATLILVSFYPAFSQTSPDSLCDSEGIVFCNGFEEGNLSVWDDSDGNPDSTNHLMADPGPLNIANNHVLRLRVPPGRCGVDIKKIFPETYDKLYARWYEYWEPGYDFNAPNHGSGLFAGDRNFLGQSDIRPAGNDFAISLFEPQVGKDYTGRPALYTYYRGMNQDCADPAGRCWGDHFPCFLDSGHYCKDPAHRPSPGKLPPVLKTGKWYCIEMMIDMGTPVKNTGDADGVLDFWIDGVEYGPWNKMWFRTTPDPKLSILWLGVFHHNRHSVEGVMLDNIVVSKNPIGQLVIGHPQ